MLNPLGKLYGLEPGCKNLHLPKKRGDGNDVTARAIHQVLEKSHVLVSRSERPLPQAKRTGTGQVVPAPDPIINGAPTCP